MSFALYRNNPLRVLCIDAAGFRPPPPDNHSSFRIWWFRTEESAAFVRKYLRHDNGGFVQIASASQLKTLIAAEHSKGVAA